MAAESLGKLRKDWEDNAQVLFMCETSEHSTLVVLKRRDKYTCHRYFQIGGHWDVSVDRQDVNDHAAFTWLSHWMRG